VYTQYGFILVNPLLNAPVGQKIAYPPLFHFLIAFLGTFLQKNYMDIARGLQPFLAFFVVLSVTFVAKKFYGTVTAISAGFLLISSLIVYRIMLPLPENLALIFFPLAIYLYYRSILEKTIKYAYVTGILLVLIGLIHQAAFLCLIIVISSFTLVELVVYRNLNILKNFGSFLLTLLVIMVIGFTGIFIYKPELLQNIFNQGITAALGYGTSLNYTQPLGVLKYIQNFGLLVTGFAVIGAIVSAKLKRKKDVYIFTWIIALLLLSNVYWLGINVLAPRLLIYIVIPLSILGGFGVSQIYYKLKDHQRFSSYRFRSLFLISVFSLSLFFGVLTVENPNMGTFLAKTEFGSVQIAPPSPSEVDLSNWFNTHGDKNKCIMISNLYTGVFIATETKMPINYDFKNLNATTPRSYFDYNKVGYIVFDKRLVLPSENATLYEWEASSEMFPLFYYNNILYQNNSIIKPDFAYVVYENNDFIVCQI
jgi:hypothetical protein